MYLNIIVSRLLLILRYCVCMYIVYQSGSVLYVDKSLEHFPSVVERNAKGKKKLRRCQLCKIFGRGRKRTHVYCADCPGQPGLCVDPCFKDHHQLA